MELKSSKTSKLVEGSIPKPRAVASLTVPGGQEFHFPHFSSNFDQIFVFSLKLYLFSSSFWPTGFSSKASNWVLIQFRWLQFVEKFSSLGPQTRQWPVNKPLCSALCTAHLHQNEIWVVPPILVTYHFSTSKTLASVLGTRDPTKGSQLGAFYS